MPRTTVRADPWRPAMSQSEFLSSCPTKMWVIASPPYSFSIMWQSYEITHTTVEPTLYSNPHWSYPLKPPDTFSSKYRVIWIFSTIINIKPHHLQRPFIFTREYEHQLPSSLNFFSLAFLGRRGAVPSLTFGDTDPDIPRFILLKRSFQLSDRWYQANISTVDKIVSGQGTGKRSQGLWKLPLPGSDLYPSVHGSIERTVYASLLWVGAR